jgi:four helix bundle protein
MSNDRSPKSKTVRLGGSDTRVCTKRARVCQIANVEDGKQLVKASGSVGANYIEANEALSKKDFLMRIKICRKESKESRYWLKLVEVTDGEKQEVRRQELVQEATELMSIFGSIVRKSE